QSEKVNLPHAEEVALEERQMIPVWSHLGMKSIWCPRAKVAIEPFPEFLSCTIVVEAMKHERSGHRHRMPRQVEESHLACIALDQQWKDGIERPARVNESEAVATGLNLVEELAHALQLCLFLLKHWSVGTEVLVGQGV